MPRASQSELGEYLAQMCQPPDTRTVVEWAEDEIWLSERQTQNPGPLSMSAIPYFKEPLNCFADADVTDLTIVAGTQTGKTTTVMVGTGYRAKNIPNPIIWVMPTRDLSKSFSENRLQPMFEDSDVLRALLPRDENKYKNLEYQLDRCTLYLVGSNSPSELASRAAGLLILDEVDKLAESSEKESDAISLAEERTKTFTSPLRVKTSTPTLAHRGIWVEYLKGTQEQYHVQCPHCKEYIVFDFKQVKWDQEARDKDGVWNMPRVKDSAHYECQNCKGNIDDGKKAIMVRNGKWVAQNKNAPHGYRSFHISSLYGLDRSCTFGNIAVKFLQEKAAHRLQNFYNSTLALPFEHRTSSVSITDITQVVAHSPEYVLGEVPKTNTACIIMTVDVQQACFWWALRAWYTSGASSLIDYGQCIAYRELMDLAKKKFKCVEDYREYSAMFCLIDSGFRAKRTGGVYDFCLGEGMNVFFPCQGRSVGHGYLKTVSESDIEHNGRPLKLIQFNDAILKTQLYIQCIKNRADNNWWLPKNVGRDYEKQLTDESLQEEKDTTGMKVNKWVSKFGENHLGDVEKMQLIIPSLLGPAGLSSLADRLKN
jgi:phage terminase large subunit GpA-like protein